MNCFRHIWFVVPALLLVACGGSGKSSETPATASEPAAKSEVSPESTAAATKSESSKPKAAEEAAPESTEPECTKDKDCSIFADCCTCKAYPVAGKLPQPCDSVCGESKCEVKGKTMDNVACVAGRCKVK